MYMYKAKSVIADIEKSKIKTDRQRDWWKDKHINGPRKTQRQTKCHAYSSLSVLSEKLILKKVYFFHSTIYILIYSE